MPFGKRLRVEKVIKPGDSMAIIGGDVINQSNFIYYKINDFEEYFYCEEYLENDLVEKIDKILNL